MAITKPTYDSSLIRDDFRDTIDTLEAKNYNELNSLAKKLTTATNAVIDQKADKATTIGGYGIADAYTKAQVDAKVAAPASSINITNLGDFAGKTVADLQAALKNWMSKSTSTIVAVKFASNDSWWKLWNSNDLTSTIEAGSYWTVTKCSDSSSPLYGAFIAHTYLQSNLPYYFSIYNGVWGKVDNTVPVSSALAVQSNEVTLDFTRYGSTSTSVFFGWTGVPDDKNPVATYTFWNGRGDPSSGRGGGLSSVSAKSFIGNATSATKLATPRTINGVAFDGTANVTSGYLYPLSISASTDLNTLTQSGVYYCISNVTAGSLINSPTTNSFSMLVEQHAGAKQTITEYLKSGARRWFRNMYPAGAWGAWIQDVDTSNIEQFVTSNPKDGVATFTAPNLVLDRAAGEVFIATITANTTIVINNPPAGKNYVTMLKLTNAGRWSIIHPTNTKFAGGTAPTLTTAGVDILMYCYLVKENAYYLNVLKDVK